jgi:predicted MFS family arabinose efflux permease
MKSCIKAKESFNYIIHVKNRNLRILTLVDIFSVVGYSMFYFSIPLFFTQVMWVSPEFYSGLLGAIAFVCLGGTFIAERTVKKRGFRGPLFITAAISGLSIIALGFSNILFIAIFFFAALEIFGVVLDIVSQSAAHHEYDSKIRASLGSVRSIILNISSSIGIFLAGVGIVMFGIAYTMAIGGGIVLLMAFVYLGMRE